MSKTIIYPSPEEVDRDYPDFDKWWRKKYGYFTITPKDGIKLYREYLEEKARKPKKPTKK